MKKLKIYVYAICKNEEENVLSWYDSMKEADGIYVLDTGSTDKTYDLLTSLNVNVKKEIINPWRFDEARNRSLDMVPEDADICVCTDLDETFEKGWRNELEKIWDKINRLSYNYNWSFDKNGKPGTTFYISKIHSRNNFKWVHPVHEVLVCEGEERKLITDRITLNHHQKYKKSRSNYLNLLEFSVKESPNDDRNMHYLGREYMYYKMWDKSIDTLIRHLNMPSAVWKDERSASMRYISRCYIALNRYAEAEMWLKKAIKETPYLREPYYELGYLMYSLNKYELAEKYFLEELKIKEKTKTYLNEQFCWDGSSEDILSICEYNLGNYPDAFVYALTSYSINPDNERIKNNIEIIKRML